MTPKQVNRLYDGLTPREQADMVFAAAARRDTDEADVIHNRVEHVTYRTEHADYHHRLVRLQSLMFVYGLEYWRIRALMLYAVEVDGGADAAERFLQKTLALEVAMVNICERFNVDIIAIKTMAQCPDTDLDKQTLPTDEADAELVTQYDEYLSAVLN